MRTFGLWLLLSFAPACSGGASAPPATAPSQRVLAVSPSVIDEPPVLALIEEEAGRLRDEAVGRARAAEPLAPRACDPDPEEIARVRAAIEAVSPRAADSPEGLSISCPDAAGAVFVERGVGAGREDFVVPTEGRARRLWFPGPWRELESMRVDLTGDGVPERVSLVQSTQGSRDRRWWVWGTRWAVRERVGPELRLAQVPRAEVVRAGERVALSLQGRLWAFDEPSGRFAEPAEPERALLRAARERLVERDNAAAAYEDLQIALALAPGQELPCAAPRRAEWIAFVRGRLEALGAEAGSELARRAGSCAEGPPEEGVELVFVPGSPGARDERVERLRGELASHPSARVSVQSLGLEAPALVSFVPPDGASDARMWLVSDRALLELPNRLASARRPRDGRPYAPTLHLEGAGAGLDRPLVMRDRGRPLYLVFRVSERGVSAIYPECPAPNHRGGVSSSVCGPLARCDVGARYLALERRGQLVTIDPCLDALEAIRRETEARSALAMRAAERVGASSTPCPTAASERDRATAAVARALGHSGIEEEPGFRDVDVVCPTRAGSSLVRVRATLISYWSVPAAGRARELLTIAEGESEEATIDVDLTGDGVPERLAVISLEHEEGPPEERWLMLSADWARPLRLPDEFDLVTGEGGRVGMSVGGQVFVFDARGARAEAPRAMFEEAIEAYEDAFTAESARDFLFAMLESPPAWARGEVPCPDPRRDAWAEEVANSLTELGVPDERARSLARAPVACP